LSYFVKEIFYSIQGEGVQSGRPAIFCRFTGCNLWNGKEVERKSSICSFCDTDFLGTNGILGGKYKSANSLTRAIYSQWPQKLKLKLKKFVIFTGGEPSLQIDSNIIRSLHDLNFEIAIETNGTIPLPKGLDWICVSPKEGADLKVKSGNEIKLVVPQKNQNLDFYSKLDFDNFLLQPMYGPNLEDNTRLAINLCKNNPIWKISLQTHKILFLP
tara:strand:+ start:94 stop:735 length:642 start_codon:yes stop_codon:yes gene_type:complete